MRRSLRRSQVDETSIRGGRELAIRLLDRGKRATSSPPTPGTTPDTDVDGGPVWSFVADVAAIGAVIAP
jgi:hypothetical protein